MGLMKFIIIIILGVSYSSVFAVNQNINSHQNSNTLGYDDLLILKNTSLDSSTRLLSAFKLKETADISMIEDLIVLFNEEKYTIVKECIADIILKVTRKNKLYNNNKIFNILLLLIQIKDYNEIKKEIKNTIDVITKYNALLEIGNFINMHSMETIKIICSAYFLTDDIDCKKVAAYSIIKIINQKINKKELIQDTLINKTITDISRNSDLPGEVRNNAESLFN